jgi:hypothetical protein
MRETSSWIQQLYILMSVGQVRTEPLMSHTTYAIAVEFVEEDVMCD